MGDILDALRHMTALQTVRLLTSIIGTIFSFIAVLHASKVRYRFLILPDTPIRRVLALSGFRMEIVKLAIQIGFFIAICISISVPSKPFGNNANTTAGLDYFFLQNLITVTSAFGFFERTQLIEAITKHPDWVK